MKRDGVECVLKELCSPSVCLGILGIRVVLDKEGRGLLTLSFVVDIPEEMATAYVIPGTMG